ncbi:hypothetical protein [Hyalangium versicolor]|uniref:hypothetical protein n=1 Tax=Hyalangium versicolor TaxID=2861190 RepID=UPI001CCFE5F3|nr:hypothetical protein [Hyalangium versicolor]
MSLRSALLPLFVAVSTLVISGCDPIKVDVFHHFPDGPWDGGSGGGGEQPPPPDGGPTDGGSPNPDGGTGSCYSDISLPRADVFAFASPGNAHYAYVNDATLFVGSTLVNEPPNPIPNAWASAIADLQLDAQNHRHLLFSTPNSDVMMYAHDRNGAWDVRPLVQGMPRALAVDSSGGVHVLYLRTEGHLFYVVYASSYSGNWQSPWGALSDSSESPALAVDAQGRAHVVYRDVAGALQYTTSAGEFWQKEFVATDVKGVPTLALDQQGLPHLLYTSQSGTVFYASKMAGTWQHVAVTGGSGYGASLRVEQNGAVRALIPQQSSTPQLVLADLGPQGWSVTPLHLNPGPVLSGLVHQTAFAYDANGGLSIGYAYLETDGEGSSTSSLHLAHPGACP